jgi:beta-lactamase class A/beta-lactamase class A VEB
MILRILLLIVFSFTVNTFNAQKNSDSLHLEINRLLENKDLTLGLAISSSDGLDTLSINGKSHLPMQSVFKFHIALIVLSKVDAGLFSLKQKIAIKKEDLHPGTWSPIRDKFPNGTKMTLAEIIHYTVALSDNNGCDLLISFVGGIPEIQNYFKAKGINELSIVQNEEEMQKVWENQFKNWTTPLCANQLLIDLNNYKLLSKTSTDFMIKTLKSTSTCPDRIRGLLSKKAIVAHKTGSSGSNEENGITAATNDIGIVYLPNGTYFYISFFVSNSKENLETNELLIASITKVTYDYFISKSK